MRDRDARARKGSRLSRTRARVDTHDISRLAIRSFDAVCKRWTRAAMDGDASYLLAPRPSHVASRASNALGDRLAHGSREFSGVDVPPSRPAARVRGARSIERRAISERATIDLFASSCRVSSRARSTRRPREGRARRAWWTSIGFASTDGARARAGARGRRARGSTRAPIDETGESIERGGDGIDRRGARGWIVTRARDGVGCKRRR